jgi:hypothetical protein
VSKSSLAHQNAMKILFKKCLLTLINSVNSKASLDWIVSELKHDKAHRNTNNLFCMQNCHEQLDMTPAQKAQQMYRILRGIGDEPTWHSMDKEASEVVRAEQQTSHAARTFPSAESRDHTPKRGSLFVIQLHFPLSDKGGSCL